jgi:hypothetical protein
VTVAKGEPWGRPGPLPPDGVEVRSDSEARAVVERARRAGEPVPALGLLGGDLCRTIGGRGDAERLQSSEAVQLPADLGSVLLDGRQFWFVAHLVARRSWWRGRVVGLFNAQYVGDWDVAPRAHPDDGQLELLDVSPAMPLRARLAARRRVRLGTHLPHPDIRTEAVAAWQTTFDPPLDVRLDGVDVGPMRNLAVRLEPDALVLVV